MAAFHFLNIFFGRKVFKDNPARFHHLPNTSVILDVLSADGELSRQILGLNVMSCYGGAKLLGSDDDLWRVICQWL